MFTPLIAVLYKRKTVMSPRPRPRLSGILVHVIYLERIKQIIATELIRYTDMPYNN